MEKGKIAKGKNGIDLLDIGILEVEVPEIKIPNLLDIGISEVEVPEINPFEEICSKEHEEYQEE